MANHKSPKRQAFKDIQEDCRKEGKSFMAFDLIEGHIFVKPLKKEEISYAKEQREKIKGYEMSDYCKNYIVDLSVQFTVDQLWMLSAATRLLKKQKTLTKSDINNIIDILFHI